MAAHTFAPEDALPPPKSAVIYSRDGRKRSLNIDMTKHFALSHHEHSMPPALPVNASAGTSAAAARNGSSTMSSETFQGHRGSSSTNHNGLFFGSINATHKKKKKKRSKKKALEKAEESEQRTGELHSHPLQHQHHADCQHEHLHRNHHTSGHHQHNEEDEEDEDFYSDEEVYDPETPSMALASGVGAASSREASQQNISTLTAASISHSVGSTAAKKKKKKKKKSSNASTTPTFIENSYNPHGHNHSHPNSSKSMVSAAQRNGHDHGSMVKHTHDSHTQNDGFWHYSDAEERQRIREFWFQLREEERRSLVRVEKEAVLKKMKEQQRHSCSCSLCGRKRTAIEEELELLYDAYYDELEQYANQQQPSDGRALTYAQHAPTFEEDELSDDSRGSDEDDDEDDEEEDDEDEDDEEDDDDDDEYEDEDDEEEYEDEINNRQTPFPYRSGFPNTLQAKGNILTVAEDLLENDGKKFLEMMDRLADRKVQRDDDLMDSRGVYEEYDDEDDGEFEDEGPEEDALTKEQRMEEGRRMFQAFAARMFEQRVLSAYREKVAQERQERLLAELEEESRQEQLREERKEREKERKRDKKRLQRQQKEEERAAKEAQRLAEEKRLQEERERKQEADRKRKEEERRAKEEEKRLREEERVKKEEERKRKVKEEKERKRKEEQLVKEREEQIIKEKEEQLAREKEVQLIKEKEEQLAKEKEELLAKEKEEELAREKEEQLVKEREIQLAREKEEQIKKAEEDTRRQEREAYLKQQLALEQLRQEELRLQEQLAKQELALELELQQEEERQRVVLTTTITTTVNTSSALDITPQSPPINPTSTIAPISEVTTTIDASGRLSPKISTLPLGISEPMSDQSVLPQGLSASVHNPLWTNPYPTQPNPQNHIQPQHSLGHHHSMFQQPMQHGLFRPPTYFGPIGGEHDAFSSHMSQSTGRGGFLAGHSHPNLSSYQAAPQHPPSTQVTQSMTGLRSPGLGPIGYGQNTTSSKQMMTLMNMTSSVTHDLPNKPGSPLNSPSNLGVIGAPINSFGSISPIGHSRRTSTPHGPASDTIKPIQRPVPIGRPKDSTQNATTGTISSSYDGLTLGISGLTVGAELERRPRSPPLNLSGGSSLDLDSVVLGSKDSKRSVDGGSENQLFSNDGTSTTGPRQMDPSESLQSISSSNPTSFFVNSFFGSRMNNHIPFMPTGDFSTYGQQQSGHGSGPSAAHFMSPYAMNISSPPQSQLQHLQQQQRTVQQQQQHQLYLQQQQQQYIQELHHQQQHQQIQQHQLQQQHQMGLSSPPLNGSSTWGRTGFMRPSHMNAVGANVSSTMGLSSPPSRALSPPPALNIH
ncbi:Stress response protein nst1 [Linnemannia zychae]|nr:Stress response protein nst1 [Linnemannia zychae]